MAFTTVWSIQVNKDASLAAEKQWKATIYRLPTSPSVSSGLLTATGNGGTGLSNPEGLATAPAQPNTGGPLGSGFGGDAVYQHGDSTGTGTGYADPLEAMQRGILYIANDRRLNGDA